MDKQKEIAVAQLAIKISKAIGEVILDEGEDLTLVEKAFAVGAAYKAFTLEVSKLMVKEDEDGKAE